MFKDLKEKVEEHNQLKIKPRLNLATAAYLLNLVFHIPLKYKDKYEDGWIPICSAPYKNLNYFKDYMEFLVEKELLVWNGIKHSTQSSTCRKYRPGGRYEKQLIDLQVIEDSSYFTKKINKYKTERMRTADDKCIHLTKWLEPEDLSIDYKNALHFVRTKYPGQKDLQKKKKRIYVIKAINNKIWSYSREGKDNRLHSILTSLPKDLREFVRFRGEPLMSFDIKNSQPFIYASIINQLINPNINLLNNFIEDKYNSLYISTISDLCNNSLNRNELQLFIDQVLSVSFYDLYGDILYDEQIFSIDIKKQCYYTFTVEKEKNKTILVQKIFKDRRDTAKFIILKTLFSSEKCPHKIIRVFEKYYTEVQKVSQFIKRGRDKNFFPIFLQNIESDCVLDYCTKKIASKYPEMPLFTIHDCIVTTTQYIEVLEVEFKKYLKLSFGLQAEVKPEPWKLNLFSAS
jgi:hypothetical protein